MPRVNDTILVNEQAAPATPETGLVVIYAKADGFLYSKDDVGTESLLGGIGNHARTFMLMGG